MTLSGRGSLFFAAASQPVHLQRVHSSGFCSVSTPALHSSLFLVVQFAYAVLMLWESIWEISIWIRAHIRECKRLPRWFVGSTRCNTHGNLSSGLQSIWGGGQQYTRVCYRLRCDFTGQSSKFNSTLSQDANSFKLLYYYIILSFIRQPSPLCLLCFTNYPGSALRILISISLQ